MDVVCFFSREEVLDLGGLCCWEEVGWGGVNGGGVCEFGSVGEEDCCCDVVEGKSV